MRIYDLRMKDGSRHFASLPAFESAEVTPWALFEAWLVRLPGVQVERVVSDGVTEAWLDFRLLGHRFSANNQHGEWWLFVADPSCPTTTLTRVVDHFECLAHAVFRFAFTRGGLQAGCYRVVVLEADGRFGARDFADLAAARAYADDAASEIDPGVPIACVLDDRFEEVYRGRHY